MPPARAHAEYVWVAHPKLGFARAELDRSSKHLKAVVVSTGEIVDVGSEKDVIPIYATTEDIAETEDLTTLLDLNAATLLESLSVRYKNKKIYTYTGRILIAINPFERIKSLFGSTVLSRYLSAPSEAIDSSGERLPPHAYGVAHSAFYDMLHNRGRNQSVLVSGESGAGKTETTKIVMEYLTKASEYGQGGKSKQNKGSEISQAVLKANPLLESFGNAKTLRNNNSSRFGKLIQMQFEPGSTDLLAATIDTYLLEKARVLHQGQGERNYHIFYELTAGATEEQKQKYNLPTLTKCRIVNTTLNSQRTDTTDKEEFVKTLDAMNTMGLSETEQDRVFSLISAILYLGNIMFEPKGTGEGSAVTENTLNDLESCAKLLNVNAVQLERTLCTRAIGGAAPGSFMDMVAQTVKQMISKDNTVEQAEEARDALTMAIYERLFMWLVWRVNFKIGQSSEDDDLDKRLSQKLRKLNEFEAQRKKALAMKSTTQTFINDCSIGCLDIFGFEVFKTNSFEQLCINYANEVLQQQFNTFVFKNEQKFYESEGIEWRNISFPDNIACIEMIEGIKGRKGRIGLLQIVDEECMYPNGNDASLHAKLMKNLESAGKKSKGNKEGKKYFTVDMRKQKRQMKFSVNHFAGIVEYSVDGFTSKNKNELRQEAVDLVRTSKTPFIRNLLPSMSGHASQSSSECGQYFQKIHEDEKRRKKRGGRGRRRQSLVRSSFQRNVSLDQNMGTQKIQQKTLGRQFRDQLYQVIRHIESSKPHYVRCIKPNDVAKKNNFNRARTLQQLNYSGVLEVVKVSRAGYGTRMPHMEFAGRFRALLRSEDSAVMDSADIEDVEVWRGICSRIMDSINLKSPEEYQIGRTQTMMRGEAFLRIERERESAVTGRVILIQRVFRSYYLRKKFLAQRKGAIKVQSHFRAYLTRKSVASFRAAMMERKRKEEERIRKEREELRRKKREEVERKRLEEERIRKKKMEEERLRREKAEQERLERLRIEEEERQKRMEAERIERENREKEERARLRILQNEAATKIQSVFRVLQAQRIANDLYVEKMERKALLDEAANTIIDVFRVYVAQKKEAEEIEARIQVEQVLKERKRLRQEERKRKRLEAIEKQERKLEAQRKRIAARRIAMTQKIVETIAFYSLPIGLMYLLWHPWILLIVIVCFFTAAIGATVLVNFQRYEMLGEEEGMRNKNTPFGGLAPRAKKKMVRSKTLNKKLGRTVRKSRRPLVQNSPAREMSIRTAPLPRQSIASGSTGYASKHTPYLNHSKTLPVGNSFRIVGSQGKGPRPSEIDVELVSSSEDEDERVEVKTLRGKARKKLQNVFTLKRKKRTQKTDIVLDLLE